MCRCRLAGLLLVASFLAGEIAKANDERASFEAPLAPRSLIIDGANADGRAVVVGQRGHILVSTDNGGHWQQAQVPTRALLTAVHMSDAMNGWAVGHDAVILRTRDGGLSWEFVHHAPQEELPLLDVWFQDDKKGYAVGAYGYFLSTVDGGENWHSRYVSEDDFHLNAVVPAGKSEPDRQRLFLAGEAGALYRSEDGGSSWDSIDSPYGGSFFGGLALDRDRIILAGLRGNLFRSDDGGNSWSQVNTETTATLTGVFRLQDDEILVTGLDGVVLLSRDGGRSFDLSRRPSRRGISGAVVLPEGEVILLGEFGADRWRRPEGVASQ